MAVRIRLKRMGTKSKLMWRIVVADTKMPRDGRFIEKIGYYNPQREPEQIEINEERLKIWLTKGAKPTVVVKNILKKKGIKLENK